MIDERLEILEKVKEGKLTPKQADKELLLIQLASVSEELENDIYNKCAEEVEDIWKMTGLSGQAHEEFGRHTFRRYIEKTIKLDHNTDVNNPFTGMSFKEFKSRVRYDKYSNSRSTTHVFFFDWKEIGQDRGFKFAVAAETKNATKAETLNQFHRWVCKNINLDYYIRYKFAATDADRFKTPLSLNF